MTSIRQRRRQRRLLHYCRELRVELDQVRLENQKLHAELVQYRNLAPVPRSLLRRLLEAARGTAARITSRRKTVRSQSAPASRAEFSPYQVRQLHPSAAVRPRVLHVIANFYTGGSARLVVDLVEHLGHRFEQDILTRDLPSTPAYVGLKIHHEELLNTMRDALVHLERLRPDFIHLHYLGHHRTAYSALDWSWYHRVFQAAEQHGYRVIENINIPVAPYVSDAVEWYVYVSKYVQRRYGRLDGRNITIYPGSDLQLFSRQDPATAPDDCIGMVYRLEGDKLNERAIDVFIEVVRRRPQTRVIIVGGGRYLQLYQDRVEAAQLGSAFTFTGYVPYESLPRYLQKMSVFVAPVHTESFGQVSPFAMGMAIPIAGYDVGALSEILGGDSLLAPPGDHQRLAEIIVDLLDDRERRLRLGGENRRRAERLFSVASMIARYSTLYDAMVAPRQAESDRKVLLAQG